MVENLDRRGGAERIQFRRHQADPSIEGRTLAAVAAEPVQAPAAPSGPSELEERLAALHPDDMSPREALQALYDLKAAASPKDAATVIDRLARSICRPFSRYQAETPSTKTEAQT